MPYGWLGNMSSEFGSIKYEGETYKTGEHLFQCLRYPKDLELLEKELKDLCIKELTFYKIPKKFIIKTELPLTALGKVAKKDLYDS